MNLRLISFCLIILFVSACGAKQAAKPDETIVVPLVEEEQKLPDIAPVKEASGVKKEERKEEKPAAEKRQEEQFVMLNFENADIETVVSTISDMLKINYILAPGVSGKITIQSHNKIPVSELFSTFQTVLEFNGFTAVKEGSFYRIVPIDTAKQQAVPLQAGKAAAPPKDSSFVTQQIPLEYVKANDIANLVRNLMPKGTDIIVYEPSNMLIITALPSGIMKLLKLLEAIDIPSTERDSVKTFIYHVENGEAKKLAEVLKNLYGKKTGTATPTPVRQPVQPTPTPPAATPRPRTPAPAAAASTGATIQADLLSGDLDGDLLVEAYDDINVLIIKSSPRAYLTLLETLRRIDIQAKQVLIEVMVAEISLTDDMSLGIEWLLKTSIHAEGKDFDVIGGFAGAKNSLQYNVGDKPGTKPGFVFPILDSIIQHPAGGFARILDPKRFSLLITAAASSGNVNVLASPNILALDNKEAKIEVGQEVPVATSVTQAGLDAVNINNTTSQVQFKSVGTILTVTPHINDKKQVTLKVNQEVSERGEPVLIGGQAYEAFVTRKANTTAIVQDGHTLVIGGIIQERVSKGRSGLPFLSSIPVLGYLFGTTSDKVEKRELLILITPHVVADKDEADALTAEYSNRMRDVKKKIDEQQRRFRQSRIVPDNPASIIEPIGKESQTLPAGQ